MLGDKKGDPQARAELLATLLAAAGEQPYWLKFNHHKATVCVVLLRVRDLPAGPPATVTIAGEGFVALSLEPGAKVGDLPPGLYDPATKQWQSTIVLTRWP